MDPLPDAADLQLPDCLTEEDFWALPDEEGHLEWLDGRVHVHAGASFRHENLFSFLFRLISGFLDARGGAIVLGSRFTMRLDRRWSPEPDILVVREERRHLITPQRLEGPADLVVEIISPSDERWVYSKKLRRYREAAIPEVWIVDPFRREVLVERTGPEGATSFRVASGRLESSVLPGFWVDAGWLWEEPLPSCLRCLGEVLGRPLL
jgi:Uma2 family endonuclease